jgi:hypothetical protein
MATLCADPLTLASQRRTEQEAAVSAMVAHDPQNALESMLVAQSVSFYHMSMQTMRRAAKPELTDDMHMRLARNALALTSMSEKLALRLERRRAQAVKTPLQQRTARQRAQPPNEPEARMADLAAAYDTLAEDVAQAAPAASPSADDPAAAFQPARPASAGPNPQMPNSFGSGPEGPNSHAANPDAAGPHATGLDGFDPGAANPPAGNPVLVAMATRVAAAMGIRPPTGAGFVPAGMTQRPGADPASLGEAQAAAQPAAEKPEPAIV